MRVREICSFDPVTCRRDVTATDIARLMRERHVGAVIVVDEAQGVVTPIGIVTDRDLAIRVMAKSLDPSSVCAGDLLARACVTVLDSDSAFEAIWQMRRAAIRRLPVVDARGHLLGIVTMDDLSRVLSQELVDSACIAEHQVKTERDWAT